MSYAEKIFALSKQWAKARDSRSAPRLAPRLFPALWFVMFAARLPSFNALVQLRRSASLNRWLATRKTPSAKELAIVSESTDPDVLRDILGFVMQRLRRNKVLRCRHGLMLAAIDGHETHSSYKRCHEGSLVREITVGGRKVMQYYNRFTVFQLIGDGFYLMLDLEPVQPDEDEVASAMRLLKRVLSRHPRCFDVLTCDALYLRPSVIETLLEANKHFVAVLKENQPDLLDEARRLLPTEPPETFSLPAAAGKCHRQVELRQAEGFTTDSIDTPLRVVHAHESYTRRESFGGKRVETPVATDWYWATTMPGSLTKAKTVFEYGHNRWRIENEGFNELVTRWHSGHVFHHHANSLLVLWLMLFITHAVFHCFLRNLQPVLRNAHSVIHFATMITAELHHDHWWPAKPP